MKTLTDSSVTIDHQIGPRGRVTLRGTSGEISLRGVEGDHVRVKADDEKAFRDRFSVELGKDSLDVNQNEKLGFGIFGRGESVDLTVEVPHGATVKIETQSGDIAATDLSGSKSFRTASGEVILKRLAGPVEVETVSGDLEIEGQAPIDLKARTVSGDVDIQVPVLRRLDLGTTSGDMGIDADLKGEGPFALRTISGDVHFVVRSGVKIEAETITGDLSSDLDSKRESGLGRKVMVVGRPGATLSFRSVSGDLRAAKPRTAAPPLEETAMTESATGDQAAATQAQTDSADADAKRLEILRSLERGEISVAEAGEQLGALDEVLR
ncbi:MAG TPA: DUF4097 family beta strand repeat-containing protein [Candidatus Limnocylindrales bacterium]|nr:DUF4097 family beta strand repeat-containing protein [Candidatus Limnocylindrales bacterium]